MLRVPPNNCTFSGAFDADKFKKDLVRKLMRLARYELAAILAGVANHTFDLAPSFKVRGARVYDNLFPFLGTPVVVGHFVVRWHGPHIKQKR